MDEFSALGSEALHTLREELRGDYARFRERGLKLDLTRGKPSAEQLDFSNELLALPGDEFRAADGTDCRNYGGLHGLPELREIFSPLLQVPVEQLIAGDSSSLSIMHDLVTHAMLFALPGGSTRWADVERPAFLCPVPGYDRHFSICEKFGIEMIAIEPTAEGLLDIDEVERLAASDPRIKGMWFVPKYSNPTGTTVSEQDAERLARMTTAADDFRIFWDDAYSVHHLTDHRVTIAPIVALCEAAGHPDRVFVLGSTSKITFAGAGVSFLGTSPANLQWYLGHIAKRTIGPDKVNHLRHVRFLKDAEGVQKLMERHRASLAPKFAKVQEILADELGGTGIATWTEAFGGYFVSMNVLDGTAAEVIRLAKEAGVALTQAGCAYPYGKDPRDRNIRLAPSFPPVADLDTAMRGVVLCVKLAAVEKLIEQGQQG
ncbi:MAG TPA: aminotransferase class I/II-fold pyridoxal phosphate-dependent enzyme [Actinospica sp.]|nr:aminotransferase class I/II-fold pyridoxal phosphate-dependent enzyme [Actinospica sp.]